MQRRLSHWILAALLVIGQAALLVHQSNIEAHAHDGHCSVCLLVHGLDNAVPSQFVLHAHKPDQAVTVATRPSPCVRQTSVAYQTRAPPLYTYPS
jgi:hypothetical protein